MRRTTLIPAALALVMGLTSGKSYAGVIPYPNSGSYNPVTYTFTASSTGDVTAYIIGGFGAGYENEMGLFDVTTNTMSSFGLDNHSSSFGDSFDLGHVNAGDTLVFVLHNLSLGMDAYSDPSLNVNYDLGSDTLGHNHIYSTDYPGNPSPLVPAGTYVAFEDLRFPSSDFNYNDESFVFTNTTAFSSAAPEPASMTLLGLGALGLAGYGWRRRRQQSANT